MSRGNGFPVACKAVQRNEQERAFRLHREKVHSTKASLDFSPSPTRSHLVLRLRQTKAEEEYLANIERENKILLYKMMRIMQRPRHGGDYWNYYTLKSRNRPQKEWEKRRIEVENLTIARRLEAVRPYYRTDKWEEDYQRHLYYLDMWGRDCTPRSPGRPKRKQQTKEKEEEAEDQYEDDFESAKSDYDRDSSSERLPDIKQDKDKEDKDNDSCHGESNAQKLPKIQSKKHDSHLYMYWGKHLNTDPDNNQSARSIREELECRKLYRVTKRMDPPTEILIRALVRRSPKQREMIKRKFHKLYRLDLATELKNGLGKPWYVLIDALLPEAKENETANENDDLNENGDGPEEALRSALESEDIPEFVKIISSKEKQLTDLKKAYREEYGVTLEDEVVKKTFDPEQRFLLNLLKERKNEGKKERVREEAEIILKDGTGRWSSPSSQFMKLMEVRSNGHIRAVLRKYEKVSKGTTAVEAIEEECDRSYAEAVAAFLSVSSKEENQQNSVSDGTVQAAVLHKHMNPESETFVNLLVERAEIDMPKIRKAYRKKYLSDLHHDLERRSRHPTVRCLLELVLKDPPGDRESEQRQAREEKKHYGWQRQSQTKSRSPSQTNRRGDVNTKEKRNDNRSKDKEDDSRTKEKKEENRINDNDNNRIKDKKYDSKAKEKKEDKSKDDSKTKDKKDDSKTKDKKDDSKTKEKKEDRSKDDSKTKDKKDDSKTKEKKEDRSKDDSKTKEKKEENRIKDIRNKEKESDNRTKEKKDESRTKERKETTEKDYDNRNKEKNDDSNTKEKKDDSRQKKKDGAEDAVETNEDVEKLHQALTARDADKEVVMDVIIRNSNAQRQVLKKKYKAKYEQELADDLKSKLSGDFEEVIVGLLMPPAEYDAYCLHKAVKGVGTNEAILIGILCTANPKELSSVKENYQKTYGRSLESAVKGDTSGGFAELLLALCRGERDQGVSVNEREAREDALRLFQGKKGKLDRKSETFKELMTKRNKEQVKATCDEYKQLSGQSLEEAVKDAASGDEQEAYLALLSALDDPVTFYADSLQKAFKGVGTDDDQLVRILVSRSEVDLPAIKSAFQQRHGRSLKAAIEDETSGDYKKALVRLLGKK